MKIFSTLIFILTFYFPIQSQNYNFSMYNQTYLDLIDPISLNNNMTWEFPNYTIPIGFDFNIANVSINNFHISSDLSPSMVLSSDNLVFNFSIIIPYGIAICDRNMDYITWEPQEGSASPISYKVIGDAGNRIFILEWKNVGFENDLWIYDEEATDYANFQMWCYETSNIIEFHYGENHFEHFSTSFDDESGPLIGVLPFANQSGPTQNATMLQGSANNPSVVYSTDLVFLDGVPSNGTVFRFTPATANINNEIENFICSVYPNPTKDYIEINNLISVSSGYIFDSLGKRIFEFNTNKIDLRNLDKGIYYIKILDDKNQILTTILLKE